MSDGRLSAGAAAGFGLLGLVWAGLLAVNLDWLNGIRFDDDCYPADPVFALGQASLGAAGLACFGVGVKRRRAGVGWLVVASIILVCWVTVAMPVFGVLEPNADTVLCPGQPPRSV